MSARSAGAVLLLLVVIGGGGYWLGSRSQAPSTSTAALPPDGADASATESADPAIEAPLRAGDRVEALSAEGWEAALIIGIDGDQARVDYDRSDLADESLDLRLLRPVDGSQLALLDATVAGQVERLPDDVDDGAARHGSIQVSVEGEYLGCFRDTSDLDLSGHLERSAQNTPERCIATCGDLGFMYAAVQYGESCLCGDSYGRHGQADNCDYACTGDPAQTCGGYSANAVYATGVTMPNPH